jgi:hypothetical protein
VTGPEIAVAVFAKPTNAPLGPIMEERLRLGVDMMYMNRFQEAKALRAGARVVWHFGGPRGSDRRAQYLVAAGCVKEPARPLTQEDARRFRHLFDLTKDGFPFWQVESPLLERQGIMTYDIFEASPDVELLPRPYQPPKPGQNFIPLGPSAPEFGQVDAWWHRVVRGRCGNP